MDILLGAIIGAFISGLTGWSIAIFQRRTGYLDAVRIEEMRNIQKLLREATDAYYSYLMEGVVNLVGAKDANERKTVLPVAKSLRVQLSIRHRDLAAVLDPSQASELIPWSKLDVEPELLGGESWGREFGDRHQDAYWEYVGACDRIRKKLRPPRFSWPRQHEEFKSIMID